MIKVILFIVIAAHQMSGWSTHVGHGWNGRSGASGIRYNAEASLAAHKTLPFGTVVRVTNNNPKSACYGKSTTVMIIDRGPQRRSACIDMMPHPLWDISCKKVGGLKVKLEVVDTRYQCSSYMCLRKLLGTSRLDDQKILELMSK